MKKLLVLVAAVLVTVAFAQAPQKAGYLWKTITYANTNQSVQIGLLPPGAFVDRVNVFVQTAFTNVTNVNWKFGITGTPGYFTLGPTNVNKAATAFIPITNAGAILSTSVPTPITATLTINGDWLGGTAVGSAVVLVQYGLK